MGVYKSNATYLITGGTGGLGLELARHLIAKGVTHLALTSRKKPSDALNQWIIEQQAQGITITHYPVDAADKKAMERVFSAIKQSEYPLKGIFHAAGLLHDALIKELNTENLSAVLAPKVAGSMHLHQLSLKLHLDCFVLFSSVASLLGNAGQSNYSAANAFMDGLAKQRHLMGLPALSINWGPFAHVGMAKNLEAQYRSQGMIPLDAPLAFAAMEHLLGHSPAQIALMNMDWSKIAIEDIPYLSHLFTNKNKKQGDWLVLLETIPAEQREQVLIDKIKEVLASILSLADPNEVDANRGFFELGMDSLMAVELRNRLQEHLGSSVKLQATLIFDYPSIAKLVGYWAEKGMAGLPPPQHDEEQAQKTEEELQKKVDEMSVSDLNKLADDFLSDS